MTRVRDRSPGRRIAAFEQDQARGDQAVALREQLPINPVRGGMPLVGGIPDRDRSDRVQEDGADG